MPNVSELAPGLNGEGLLLEGWASTPTLDRHNDQVNPKALEASFRTFLATNPVLLFHHKKSLPPVGRILEGKITDAGLWVKAVMPRPQPGTFAAEVFNAVKEGLLRALSLGAKWTRIPRGGHNEVVKADIQEVSLAPVSVGLDTLLQSVHPTEAKALCGEWMSVPEYEARLEAAQEWLGLQIAGRELQRVAAVLDVVERLRRQ